MPWLVAMNGEDGLYVSTENFLGPHLWSETDAECWFLDDEEVVQVPPGCYHITMNRHEASQWESLGEANRIASAVNAADPDGDYWRPRPA